MARTRARRVYVAMMLQMQAQQLQNAVFGTRHSGAVWTAALDILQRRWNTHVLIREPIVHAQGCADVMLPYSNSGDLLCESINDGYVAAAIAISLLPAVLLSGFLPLHFLSSMN